MQLFSSWTGSDFLLFYTALLGFSAVAAWWIPAQLRAPGRLGESPDAEDVALLAGGHKAHTDSVIADLFARGGISDVNDRKMQVVQASLPASPAGRALLAASQPFTRSEADSILAIHANRIAARLRREGLMLHPEDLGRLRWLSITPFVALFLLGLYRQRAGAAEGEATGFLVILMVLTIGLTVFRFARFDERTTAGVSAIARLKTRHARLARAPLSEEVGMAVALFGTGVLVGTPWEPVHALKLKDGSDGGGGGSGDSDGGGDGGGGGCGGCGG
ncbi:MAG TPA: TIGR04222 domain-containing membrane protein [Erythrobacter sp.]|nr:TIGR04222 domain-containing membrane protein [Erythrobacter sp.]